MPRAFLMDQLRRMHGGDAWHGPSLTDALRDVTAPQAFFRPVAGAHTIFELTHHCAAWVEEVTSRIQGRAPGEPALGDFPDLGVPHTGDSWRVTRQRLDDAHAALRNAIETLTESGLQRMVGEERDAPLGTGFSIEATIHGVIQHDAYHAGQIVLLRKAIGNRA